MNVIIILLLIALNGVFAMSEIAVVSARKVRLQQMADEGNRGAKAALELANAPNRFLSTVQVGITLIGILAGAFGGASLAKDLEAQLERIDGLEDYSQPISVALVVVGITYLSLVIGELVPKRLGMQSPERAAALMARPMNWLSRITAPVVKVLSLSTEGLMRLMGTKPTDQYVTELEIIAMIRQGIDIGVFEETEQEMVEGVFRLDEQRVVGVMTPRTDIVWLDVDDPFDEIRAQITEATYSVYPVCQGSIDNVLGIVRTKDLLVKTLAGEQPDLRTIMQRPLFVPESVSASRLLELFKSSNIHVAFVLGEHGDIEGMVTLNDILEEIVGEIDEEDPEAIQRQDGSWLLDGLISIHKVQDIFPDFELPDDEEGTYVTLAGFVMARLGRVPSAADSFTWENLHFEVMDMDGRRVDKVLVKPLEKPKDEQEEERN